MTEKLEAGWEPEKFAKYEYDEQGYPRQVVWDVSSLDNLLRCPTYYKYSNLDGLRLATPPSATYFGHAVHHGFEILEGHKFYGKTQDEAVDAALLEIIEKYGEGLRGVDDSARNLQAACRAIVWRADEYWNDPLEVVAMPDETPALEVRFEVPLDFIKQPLRLSGRIDKIVSHNNDLYIVDTKTTKKMLNSYFFDMYMPSTQVYGYMWVCREVLGLQVRGFIIDAVQTLAESTRFGRATFDIGEDQIKEWKFMVGNALNSMDHYQAVFPHNYSACGNFGGCTYRQLCSRPAFLRPTYIEESYVQSIHPALEVEDETT